MIRIATAFSGIGSPEMALKQLEYDHEVVFACEIDKFARQSYKAIYEPTHDFHTDVREVDGTSYKDIDLFVWGFPCQDYSIAGKRAGLEGQRGTLFYEGARITKEMRPKYFIAENVKGLLSSNEGQDIETIMEILRHDVGYHVTYAVLNTKDYGIPQNRERVFIVGFRDDLHHEYISYEYPKPFKLEKRLKDILEDDVDEKYYIDHTKFNYKGGDQLNPEYESQANTIYSTNGTAPTLCAFTHGYAQGYFKEPQKGVVCMLDIKGNDQIRRVYGVDGEAPCLQTMQGGNREPKILDDQGRLKKMENPQLLEHCPTLRAQSHGNEPKVVYERTPLRFLDRNQKNIEGDYAFTVDTTNTGGVKEIIGTSQRIRKLTPKECWRLQGFPDWSHDKAKADGVSDSQLYKQAGNSITVDVMMYLIQSIFEPNPKESLF